MKKLITLSAILAACTFAVPAMARHGGDRVDARQDRQQHRIAQGYRSGDLTRAEARRLERGQHRIDRMQHRAERDGRVTRHERRRMHEELARQDRHIYRERHDRERWRGDRGWHRGYRHAPAWGYVDRDYRPVREVQRVYVDPMPRVSLILNLP
ncbi:hypothetical protein G3580_12275 [Nitrogeniibacter mangrovi]|uniref:Uncharacterized protein n=1 Tax=Nitrogeniibacter mangrovi TaxID=2016596 RepID=A0A6C1B6C6_9RHOO|nr:hypothetical protein [Nitrogeniibacter mangrovi]QID18345.1 hypothetical protein G3580_12275 [Nitrogeniibacter mangrovi]